MRLLLVLVLPVVCSAAAPAQAADWQWPLSGDPAVSRSFTAPAHRYAAGHRGADLPSAPGAPVLAAGGGWVSYAGLVAGRGVVAVVHGDLRTTYEPVTAVVGVGQPVVAGQVLGTLEPGHAGCPVPACLHWGLRRGDDHLDPVRLVQPGPVRLLPLHGAAPAAVAVGAPEGVAPQPGRRPAVAATARRPAGAAPRSSDVGLAATAGATLLAAGAVAAARHRRS